MKNQSGQALLETIYVFQIGVMMFTLIFMGVACGWSFFWAQYQLQDAVICLSDNSSFECHRKYQKLIQQGASYLKISNLILEKRTTQLYGKIDFKIPFSGKSIFKMEKVIQWPIRQ